MDTKEVIQKIDEKIERISLLRGGSRFSPEYKKWHRESRVLLERVFGVDSYQVSDFKAVQFVFRGGHNIGDDRPFERKYRSGLEDAAAILMSIKEEIMEYGLDLKDGFSSNPIIVLEELLKQFHAVSKQLRRRYNNRPTLDIEDEYDVQDLLHSLLRIFFKDIRAEEWTPSYAGSSSRMDFLLLLHQKIT